MRLNPDYCDMFKTLNTAGVRYLVIGGYAYGFHVEPRTTKDLDIWVDPASENENSTFPLYTAPSVFSARHAPIPPRRFTALKPFRCNKWAAFKLRLPLAQ